MHSGPSIGLEVKGIALRPRRTLDSLPLAPKTLQNGQVMVTDQSKNFDGPVLLFDGVCNLCNGAVNFIIDRDPEARFRFASLQSEVGRSLLAEHGLSDLGVSTMVLLEGNVASVRSRGVLRVAALLGGWFRLASLLSWLPTSLLDRAYRLLATRRYAWFGRNEACRVPTPELRSRFL